MINQGISRRMKSKMLLKPCCSKYKKFALVYQDIVIAEDERLRLLVDLLSQVNPELGFTKQGFQRIADEIQFYLDRKVVRDHYFFGRTLSECSFDAADLGAELCRTHNKYKESL